MWNVPDKARLDKIPRLYQTEETPAQEKLVYLHFFFGACDWFIVEFDGEDLFFGFAVINGDLEMAEWGYVSFSELKGINMCGVEIDCELEHFWKTRPAKEVDLIKKAQEW